MRRRSPGGWLVGSWIALAASMVIFTLSSRWLWRLAALPEPATASPRTVPSTQAAADSEDDQTELSRDLFRAGGLLPNVLALRRPPPDTLLPMSIAAVHLLGTVIRASGSFALCQLPADIPRIVHVGERLGELTLISLEQGRAVFQAPRGARLELVLSNIRS